MVTVKTYLTCPHCSGIICVSRSDEKELSNLMLCPLCRKNLFSIIEIDEVEDEEEETN